MNDKVDSIREAAEQLVTQVGILYAFIPNSSSVQACKKAAEELRDVLSKTAEADLIRENAELRASHARMREALKGTASRKSDTKSGFCWCSFNPHLDGEHEFACTAFNGALAESPATSLAAITAPLEAWIAELESELQKIAWHLPTVCYEQSEERYVNIEEVFSLKRIAADLLVRTPKQSLAAIQAAARAEEREVCAKLAHDWFGPGEPEEDPEDSSWITSHYIAQAISSRGNGGELKGENHDNV